MTVNRLAALACVFVAACSAPRSSSPDLLPLTSLRTHELQYEGHLSPEGISLATSVPDEPPTSSLALVEMSCRIFKFDRELVPSLVAGDLPWLRADSVPREEAEAYFATIDGDEDASFVTNMTLMLHSGQRGTVAATNQTAFVKSYELAASGAVFMADPEIGISQEGLWMGVSTSTAGVEGNCTVDLELRLAELQRPIQTASGRMPGTDQPMTVQLPLFATQSLVTSAELRPGEALLVGPVPAFDGADALLFLLTIEQRPEPVASR